MRPSKIAFHGIRHGGAGNGRCPLADDDDAADATVFQGRMDPCRHDVVSEIERNLLFTAFPFTNPVLAQQGLVDGIDRFVDFLQKKMGIGAAVDVPGRHFGPANVGRLPEKGNSVIVKRLDSGNASRRVLVQDQDLAGRTGILRNGKFLAVHLNEPGRLLHQTVQFRGKKIPVRRDADVNRLTAPFQGEEDPGRLQAADHGNGMRTLEIADGPAEGLRQVASLQKIFLDLKRDDFGVRRQLGRDAFRAVFDPTPKVGIIVHVAVERRADGPGALAVGRIVPNVSVEPVIVDGMAVVFGDGTHRGPPRVGQRRFQS